MLLYIFLALAVAIVAGFVMVVSMRPSEFRVQRSATMAAPAAAIFAQVNDFHNWDTWSPWAKIDPACKTAFGGAAAGPGAMFSWEGNKKVGAGKMTIMESRSDELVRIKLEFLRPFKATNTAEFTFRPQDSGTLVAWSMFGKQNFAAKAFGMFVDCGDMVGKDFDKGLASMKAIVESEQAMVGAV